MIKQKEKRSFSNFGFSTILLSFVMICVVTFSALSLVTANSDYKLSKKVAEKTSAYYMAHEAAYDKLTMLETILAQCYNISYPDGQTYYKLVKTKAADYGTLAEDSEGYYFEFQEPIAEDQHLSVRLRLNCPETDTDYFYEIIEWKSVYTREAPEDVFLDLMEW